MITLLLCERLEYCFLYGMTCYDEGGFVLLVVLVVSLSVVVLVVATSVGQIFLILINNFSGFAQLTFPSPTGRGQFV